MSNEQVDYIEARNSAEGRRSLLIFRLNTAGIGSEDEQAVRELLEQVAALKAEIARRDAPVTDAEWQPITPENLPKVGDEVGAWFEGEGFAVCEFGPSESSLTPEQQFLEVTHQGWTHFRPIKPPMVARATPPHGGKQ